MIATIAKTTAYSIVLIVHIAISDYKNSIRYEF